MAGEEDLKIAVLYLSGDLTGRESVNKYIDYLSRSKSAGNSTAKFLYDSKQSIAYGYLEGVKLGGERAFQKLSTMKRSRQLAKSVAPSDLPKFESALKNFTPMSPAQLQKYKQSLPSKNKSTAPTIYTKGMSPNAMFDKGIRYYIGEETGRQNTTQGNAWLTAASNAGHAKARKILATSYPLYYANIAGGEMGYVRAIKKVTQWHMKGEFKGIIPDRDLIDFAKKVVSMGDIY